MGLIKTNCKIFVTVLFCCLSFLNLNVKGQEVRHFFVYNLEYSNTNTNTIATCVDTINNEHLKNYENKKRNNEYCDFLEHYYSVDSLIRDALANNTLPLVREDIKISLANKIQIESSQEPHTVYMLSVVFLSNTYSILRYYYFIKKVGVIFINGPHDGNIIELKSITYLNNKQIKKDLRTKLEKLKYNIYRTIFKVPPIEHPPDIDE